MHACLIAPWLAFGFVVQAPSPKPAAGATPTSAEQSPAPGAQNPAPQGPAPKPAVAPPAQARVGTVQFDSSGWPIVADETPPTPAVTPPAPGVETARPNAKKPPASSASLLPAAPVAAPEPEPQRPALASGTQLGSPLLDVFQSTRSPAAFKELGGIVVWWRLSTFGAQGEVIGVREITHTADCAFAERDRLELGDGRVYGRSGASVFAERNGMPWPTLTETAQQDLLLFGLHLRLPWCFGEATGYVVVGRDTVARSGETLARVQIERRSASGSDLIGPELDPTPCDRFELLYEPSTGVPREFVHRLACSKETRRVLLEDWRDTGSVRMPYRRVYVDESLRSTTTLEILRVEQSRTSERDFRLR